MGADKTNMPIWWQETHNNVATAFGVLIPATVIFAINGSVVAFTLFSKDKLDSKRVKKLMNPTLYYMLTLFLAYFSSNLYTCIFSWV